MEEAFKIFLETGTIESFLKYKEIVREIKEVNMQDLGSEQKREID